MAEGRAEAAWDHTAALLCQVANIFRDPKKGSALKVSDFHPLRKKPAAKSRLTIAQLRDQYGALLTGAQPPGRAAHEP
jgi:hypothetical protein